MDASPFLSAIQSLNGETPGEKCKDLHLIASKIIENNDETEKFLKTSETSLVPPALVPNLLIIVGLKVKSKDAVVKALKSDDVTIIKLALRAKWFFNASNELINVQYFNEHLLPFVSLRTRLELIKVLSKCLQAQQAESFHHEFVLQFGGEQAQPILFACGEDYIYDEILKQKILLSERKLKQLYREKPGLVIRYLRALKTLRLQNKCGVNVEIGCYSNFLPNLVKNHSDEFVEFGLTIDHYHSLIELGHTRAKYFLNNCTEALVKNPNVFLEWLPVKLVKRQLSKQQYDDMLKNLFPDDVNKLYTTTIAHVIETYYPKDTGFELYRTNYQQKYAKDLLKHKDLFEENRIFDMIPWEIKANSARVYVNSIAHLDKSIYWSRIYRLEPSESIPLLKDQIKKSAYLQRDECLRDMLKSCNLYKSNDHLLDVLTYYNTRHKNEQSQVLLQWLECLAGLFDDMKSLEKGHWQVVKEIVQRAYVKGDLFVKNWYFDESRLFGPMLRYFFEQSSSHEADEDDKLFLDKIMNIILEYHCEYGNKWDFIGSVPEYEGMCLDKCLTTVAQKYPENHEVWTKNDNKRYLSSYLIDKLGKFNEKTSAEAKFIDNYPLLGKFARELCNDKSKDNNLKKFRTNLRKYFSEFYESIVDENSDLIYDVTTNDALMALKRDPSKISSKIDKYVTECRKQLSKGNKFTRHFVRSLKWYQDIPLKFVEKCSTEIEEEGSILLLGLLLDGRTLTKIIQPYLPKESTLEVNSENAKKDYKLVSSIPLALNYANPPPNLKVLVAFCKGDYLSVALQTLSSIAQRLPVDRVLSFADHLTNNVISVKKAGIRLVCQVSMKPQTREFLSDICKQETNPGIREVTAKLIYEVFTQAPSEDNWQMMKQLISSLLPDDKKIYDVLKNLKSLRVDYMSLYIFEILKKIDSFNNEELNEKERGNLISWFLDNIDDKQVLNELSENLLTEIVTKYMLDCSVDFMFSMYLFSDERKFDDRLTVFIKLFSEALNQINQSDPDQKRFYPYLTKFNNKFSSYNVFNCLLHNENKEMNRRLVARVLEVTSLQKDLECFINFNVYQNILDASDAKNFGERCGKNLDDIIKLYDNQLIIEYYGRTVQGIISRTSFEGQHFDIIDGLMNHKFNYGVSIGIKLLSSWNVNEYDDRYDKFVDTVKNSDDLMAQVLLNNFIKECNGFFS